MAVYSVETVYTYTIKLKILMCSKKFSVLKNCQLQASYENFENGSQNFRSGEGKSL